MFKTVELIDKVKTLYHLPSDYAAAKKIGVSTQAVSKYRNNHTFLDDKAAFKIAELLELDPAQVLACANIERAERQGDKNLIEFWQRYAH